jgi:hypothetical protein
MHERAASVSEFRARRFVWLAATHAGTVKTEMQTGPVTTLARRLGKTVHASPLRFKLERLRRRFPCAPCACVEDWMLVVANARGARVVTPPFALPADFSAPPPDLLSNEELVCGICQPNALDRPQMLRLAAQLVSRGAVDVPRLGREAERERAGPILAELSRQALKVDPDHPAWRALRVRFAGEPPLREPLLHWTRLAEPVMKDGRCNAESWRLVA